MLRPCPPTPERRVGSIEARRGLTTSRQLAPTTSTLHRSPPPPGAAPYDPATIPTRIYADMRTDSAKALVQMDRELTSIVEKLSELYGSSGDAYYSC